MPKQRERQGLRPVQDVVGRLRHDPSFDASRFVIAYEERFKGQREAPLLDFLAGSEIPWHRIHAIKAGDLCVWDRHARIDLLFGSGESHSPDHAAIHAACQAPAPALAPEKPRPRSRPASHPASHPAAHPAALTPRTCWRFDRDRGAWTPAGPAPAEPAPSLLVATFNLLFDRHEAERIYSERRLVAALALLRGQAADLIALQEVTPASLAALLAEPWVRDDYYVSSGPDSEGVDPYGVVLLSRWPLALVERRFSAHKAILLGRLDLAGRPLHCAALHLTSNHKDDASERRADEFAALAALLADPQVADALVLGDLNFGDDDDAAAENQRLAAAGLVDVWPRLRPHDPGFTFDPAQNPLAALMTRRGRPARFDRVLLRAPAGRLAPIEITRFGDRPFARDGELERYASDHFGLAALLEIDDLPPATIDAPPVHQSALVLLPPATTWPAIQAIRRDHDPSHPRWMPHVNLIYGFVDREHLPAAAAAIAARLRARPPIRARLGALRRFDHRGSTTLWIEVQSDPPGALRELQADLQALFPACREQSERAAEGYTPHLTVARVRGDEAEIAATLERLRPRIPAGEWLIDAVHLIHRDHDQPFTVRHSLSLGTSNQPPLAAPPRGAAWASPAHQQVAAALAAACAEALAGPLRVHLVGSARLGVAAPDADLDLVCVHAEAPQGAPAAVAAALTRRGPLRARTVQSAGVIALRGEFAGIDFDLLFARAPAPLVARDPADLRAADLVPLDEPSRRALLGCVDADALVRLAGPDADAFRGALARVRRWTRARALEGGAWGLLGGYTWAVLVAACAHEAVQEPVHQDRSRRPAPLDPWTLCRRFFTTFAAWPSARPVLPGPPPPAPEARRAPWPIYTPTPPTFNSARGLTPTTLALLQRELRRAAAIVAAEADEPRALAELCAPPVPDADLRLELTVRAADPEALAAAQGLVDGRALGLLLALEAAGAALRPLGWEGARASVDLRGGDPAELRALVDAAVTEWQRAAAWPAPATIAALLAPVYPAREPP